MKHHVCKKKSLPYNTHVGHAHAIIFIKIMQPNRTVKGRATKSINRFI